MNRISFLNVFYNDFEANCNFILMQKPYTIKRIHSLMRGIQIFEIPYYREIRPMRGLPYMNYYYDFFF